MIDTSAWKEFRVGDLFEVLKGSRLTKDDKSEGSINFVSTSIYNNGVINKIGNTEHIHPSNTMVVVYDGHATGRAYYQDEPYWASDSVNVLYPKFQLNKYIGLFLVPIFEKAGEKFVYTDKWNQEKMIKTSIYLPITSTGHPDWDYMESYMKAVMEKSEKSLENLKKADDTKHLIDMSGWGEFSVLDFFEVLKGKNKLSNVDIDDGDTPVYSSNSTNGGIFGYTTKEPDYVIDDENPLYITFGDHTKAIKIAEESFCVMDNVKVLSTKLRNQNVLRFIMTSWIRNVPDLGYARHWAEAEKTVIYLPITSTGEPDWQYMEDYMKSIMDKSEQIISDLQIGV